MLGLVLESCPVLGLVLESYSVLGFDLESFLMQGLVLEFGDEGNLRVLRSVRFWGYDLGSGLDLRFSSVLCLKSLTSLRASA